MACRIDPVSACVFDCFAAKGEAIHRNRQPVSSDYIPARSEWNCLISML